MSNHSTRRRLTAAIASAAALIFSGMSSAQAPDSGYLTPRTEFGAPDLQGFWNSTSITSLERASGVEKLVVSETQGVAIVNDNCRAWLRLREHLAARGEPNPRLA